jgi:4-amino-4-deoxy-L-arabinose transferase-like glycosyltransferase
VRGRARLRLPADPFARRLALVVAAGLAVRVTYTLVVDPQPRPVSDATSYHLLANHLADGHGFVRPYDLEWYRVAEPTTELPPLFPLLLGVVAALGGTSVVTQRLFTCALGAATVAAVHPLLFQPDGVLMAETPFALLVTATLLLAYRALDRPSLGRGAVVGAVVGLAALTRSEGLLLLPLLVVPLAVGARALGAVRRRVGLAAVALAAGGLVLLPWTVRNAVEFDRLVPVTSNLGTLVAGANCPATWYGPQTGLWRLDCTQPIDVTGLDEVAASTEYRAAGLDFAGDHLGRLPRVLAVRLLRTWGLFRPGQQVDYETLEGRTHTWQTAGMRLDWALLPLAGAGLVVLRRRRAVPVWPLLSTAALASVTALLAYGNQRFRVAAEPVLAVLAAVTVVTVVSTVRRRRASP